MIDSSSSLAVPPVVSPIPEVTFALNLGRALQEFGVSAQTLENALGRLAHHLGLEGAVYATPTGFLASFQKLRGPSKTYLIRTGSYSANLAKLAETEALVDRVIDDSMGVDEALWQLEQISRRSPRFGPLIQIGAYAIAAMGMAVVFGGGWREALLSSLIGALVGLAAQFLEQKRNQISLAPLVGGIISSLGGIVLGNLVPSISHPILILSGFIVLVPGLGLLVSMQELGTGNLVAGTSRLVGTGFVLMLLAFGVAIGQRLGSGWYGGLIAEPKALPFWAIPPAIALVALGYLVVFQGALRDYTWTLGASIVAYGSARMTTQLMGPEVGSGIAALVLGAVCNHYSRRTRRPGAVLLLPSLMLIVPGSKGFQGLLMVLHKHTLEGLQAGFQSLTVTVALMLGLLLANVLVPRRRF